MDFDPLTELFGFDVRPYTSTVTFESGDVIVRKGSRPKSLYYLAEGRAKVYLSHENGRVSLINFLGAPSWIGEMELLDAREAANDVIAITRCTCRAISLEECRDRLLKDAVFLRNLCHFLSRKAAGNSENYSLNQTCSLETRLAGFILMTQTGGVYRERHTEAAEYLGTTYRNLLYGMAKLVRAGALEKSPQGYRIADMGTLRDLANAR